jgi:uncharacterized pyridoxal phosphate-dependent enzyme
MGLYEEVGICPFINARAPYTRFGGAIMPDEVVRAMAEASQLSVHMAELQNKVGRAIARLTHNEAAYVSCGAASGITLTIAYCIAGVDEQKADGLPFTNGLPNRVVMHDCDRGTECDTAIRCAGGVVVTIGNQDGAREEELRAAIDASTVAVVTLLGDHPGKVPLDRMIAIAHERGVPLIIDAAGGVPPRENFWRYTRDAGADAIVISGGKGVRGPQSTGFVLGAGHIIEGCCFHGVPNCRIGRGMKVGKEELFGAYAAVKWTMAQDEAGVAAVHEQQAEYIVERLDLLPNVTARKVASHHVQVLLTSGLRA